MKFLVLLAALSCCCSALPHLPKYYQRVPASTQPIARPAITSAGSNSLHHPYGQRPRNPFLQPYKPEVVNPLHNGINGAYSPYSPPTYSPYRQQISKPRPYSPNPVDPYAVFDSDIPSVPSYRPYVSDITDVPPYRPYGSSGSSGVPPYKPYGRPASFPHFQPYQQGAVNPFAFPDDNSTFFTQYGPFEPYSKNPFIQPLTHIHDPYSSNDNNETVSPLSPYGNPYYGQYGPNIHVVNPFTFPSGNYSTPGHYSPYGQQAGNPYFQPYGFDYGNPHPFLTSNASTPSPYFNPLGQHVSTPFLQPLKNGIGQYPFQAHGYGVTNPYLQSVANGSGSGNQHLPLSRPYYQRVGYRPSQHGFIPHRNRPYVSTNE